MSDPSSLPLYVQICEALIRDILAGRLLDGERLQPERVLATSLGTSVGTLRKSLNLLEERGMLRRVQGSGNYVNYKSDAESVYALFRLELLEGGGLPTAKILSVDTLEKPEDLPAFGSSNCAHRIRRLRFLSGKAAAVEEIWLDGSYCQSLSAAQLSESLYLFYKDALGLIVTRAQDSVGVGHVPDWAPEDFGPKIGDTAGFVERISWVQDNTRAEFSRTWFDNDRVRYVARLK